MISRKACQENQTDFAGCVSNNWRRQFAWPTHSFLSGGFKGGKESVRGLLSRALVVCTAALAFSAKVYGEEKSARTTPGAHAPPPTQAIGSAGLLNDWLRQQDPAFNAWDLGGQFRARYEIKEDGGSFPNRDFRASGVDNDNSYLLLREKIHVGYTPCAWFSVFAEGRDSSSSGDDRDPNPEADQFDLHQGFVTLGDAAKFPFTAKIGRQELIYGDERLVGNGDWGHRDRDCGERPSGGI